MNFILALAKAGIPWTIEPTQHAFSAEAPDRLSPALKVTMQVPDAGQLVAYYRDTTERTVDRLLVSLLKNKVRNHPLVEAWLESHGNVPVVLKEGVLEHVSEAMHTALRKLADSKQSIITWNALHHLHPLDHAAFWQEVRDYLGPVFEKNPRPLRRQVAKGLSERVVDFFDNRKYVDLRGESGELKTRTNLQEYALLTMYVGCRLTDIEEWMWGWLGYVVEEAGEVPEDVNR